jgi:menaquinone-9 beta-reductase
VQQFFDVAVVGASISGSLVASLLGERGVHVALIDKSQFPRHKPCGEGLSFAGYRALQSLTGSLLTEQESQESSVLPSLRPFYGFQLKTPETVCSVSTQDSIGVGVKRLELDFALLKYALRHADVIPFLGSKVTRLSFEPDRVRLEGVDLNVTASYVVLADGACSSIGTKVLGVPATRYGKSKAGITTLLDGTFEGKPKHVSVFLNDDYEIYCTPLNHALNISVLADYRSTLHLRKIVERQETLQIVSDHFGFRGGHPSMFLGRAPLGNSRRKPPPGRIFFVGDALEELDPLGGMGMTHAVYSAKLCAESLHRIFVGMETLEQGARSYLRNHESMARPLRGFTRLWSQTVFQAKKHPALFDRITSSCGNLVLRSVHREGLQGGIREHLTHGTLSLIGALS